MWRRIISSKTLTLASSAAAATGKASAPCRSASTAARLLDRAPVSASAPLFAARYFSTDSENASVPKKVEDIMPIATGHEREELEAELKGIDLLEMDHPLNVFGTKEKPAIVRSIYNKRIVGCVGDPEEEEHDLVWFWLEKDKPYTCPVCSQYVVLEVVGPGGPPPGHEDEGDDHHHHH